MTELVTSDHLYDMLRKRYAPPAYAIFGEVANGTGLNIDRYADAVAMSLWPSRGLDIIGFEIKVSRSDLVAELNNPKKSEAIQKYCDRWFIVLSDESLIKEGELPSSWGLMVKRGDRLIAKKEAPQLSPVPLDRVFVASMLRRASETQDRVISQAVVRGKEESRQEVETLRNEVHRLNGIARDYESLRHGVEDFEKEVGQKLTYYSGSEIARRVKIVGRHLGLRDPRDNIKGVCESLKRYTALIEEDLKTLNAIYDGKGENEKDLQPCGDGEHLACGGA